MTQYPDIRLRKKNGPTQNDLFEVCEPCQVSVIGPDLTLVIPSGYVTDFASVPQWLWWLVPPHGRLANAAVVHDYMYDQRMYERELGVELARLLADGLFLRLMLLDGVPAYKARAYYCGVRILGLKWWTN